ncbi:MAG: SDR family oxidoreductase [Rhodanobacteraceae bacterium]
MSKLDGKVAWITGAGSGIGQAGALALAQAGARIVVSGRRADALRETCRQINDVGGEAEQIALDVADKGQVTRASKWLLKHYGRCDVLVNSAGINVPKRHYPDLVPKAWDRVINTNLNGTLYCISAVLPAMRAHNDGLVINISSWAGRWISYLVGPAYGSSKHAVAALTHHLNLEEGIHGIRACVIYPGEVVTPILKARPVPPSQSTMDKMLSVEDVARAISFVAEMPPHVCINELVVSPTWNRISVGGQEVRLGPDLPE